MQPCQASLRRIGTETPGRKIRRQAAERRHVTLLDLERVEKYVVVYPRAQQCAVEQHLVGVLPEEVVPIGMPGQCITRLREVVEFDVDDAARRRGADSVVSLEPERSGDLEGQIG
jgi:hypothetical protein